MQAKKRSLHAAIEGLQLLADLFDQRREQIAREVGLTVPQWRVLDEISREDFMPSLFARRRACSPAAVSKTLRPLIDQGLVRVSVSREDRRQRIYELSARGRGVLERVRALRARAIEAIWSDLDAGELARFADFSQELGQRLESYIAEQ